jgi:hypothetical protein
VPATSADSDKIKQFIDEALKFGHEINLTISKVKSRVPPVETASVKVLSEHASQLSLAGVFLEDGDEGP